MTVVALSSIAVAVAAIAVVVETEIAIDAEAAVVLVVESGVESGAAWIATEVVDVVVVAAPVVVAAAVAAAAGRTFEGFAFASACFSAVPILPLAFQLLAFQVHSILHLEHCGEHSISAQADLGIQKESVAEQEQFVCYSLCTAQAARDAPDTREDSIGRKKTSNSPFRRGSMNLPSASHCTQLQVDGAVSVELLN